MSERYKSARGKQLSWSKLTEDDVREIRARHAYKMQMISGLNAMHSAKKIAEDYGVHVRTIEKILQYYTWVHVK